MPRRAAAGNPFSDGATGDAAGDGSLRAGSSSGSSIHGSVAASAAGARGGVVPRPPPASADDALAAMEAAYGVSDGGTRGHAQRQPLSSSTATGARGQVVSSTVVGGVRINVPVRSPSEAATFGDLAADVRAITALVSGLRRLLGLMGGPRDTLGLREGLEAGVAEIRARLRTLERCIRHNRDVSLAAAAARSTELGYSSVSAEVAGGAGSATRMYDQLLREGKPGASGGSGGAFDAARASGQAGGGSSSGCGAGRASAGAARLSASAPPDRRAWDKLASDCAAVARLFQAEEAAYSAALVDYPAPVAAPDADASERGAGGPGGPGAVARYRNGGANEHPHFRGNDGGYVSYVEHGDRGGSALSAREAASLSAVEAQLLQRVQVLDGDETEVVARIIDERDVEITHIAREVNELAEVFRDLGTLVKEQGSGIDAIASNIEAARGHVEGGVRHLQEADQLHKGAACVVA
jgi:hypothetical protein